MSTPSSLEDYLEKRDFSKTPEPPGRVEDEDGGVVTLVWDAGIYKNLKTDPGGEEVSLEDQIEDGHLTVWIEGEDGP
jgi:hypothetical protein